MKENLKEEKTKNIEKVEKIRDTIEKIYKKVPPNPNLVIEELKKEGIEVNIGKIYISETAGMIITQFKTEDARFFALTAVSDPNSSLQKAFFGPNLPKKEVLVLAPKLK
ncbi:MAG: hypothetical protein ACP5FX_03340, partial [Candidatus Micrarchaeia archaeon]